ncbi:MAG TPA: C40 family peptidase [Gaiellales bacterium]|nr:C40 family peptidase [Gaiellales bacterium]
MAPAAVAAIVLLAMGIAVLGHLAAIRSGGARGQATADVAALAAARVAADDPDAPAPRLRSAAAAAARANGGTLRSLRVESRGPGIPVAIDVTVAATTRGDVPGVGRRADVTLARARAGVAYSARLPVGTFRPVALSGASGAAAAVRAAEAQIGWPYVWGGESRAEGGFDCSGLVDFALSAAGVHLPGRPTAADLWRLARPEPASSLAPGDLVFLGSNSGAPYHVGMYVGQGTVVAAPHTGAVVRYEPLATGGWDGFARILADGGAEPPPGPVDRAARRHQVPANVLQAVLALDPARAPDRTAAAIAAGQRRHPGDLAGALIDALGDSSLAALVLHRAAGPGLGEGFRGEVRLLPLEAGPAPPAVAATVPLLREAPGGGRSGLRAAGAAGAALDEGDRLLEHLSESDAGRNPLGGFAAIRHLSRLGLNALTLLPNRTLGALGSVAGSTWDVVAAAVDLAAGGYREGFAFSGFGLWAARLTLAGALLAAAGGLFTALTARTRRGRIVGGLELAGGGLQAAGLATAGTDLIVLGAAGMEVPPVGVALILAGTAITAGVAVYQAWPTLRRAGGRVGGWLANRASAAWDGARSLAGSLPTPW